MTNAVAHGSSLYILPNVASQVSRSTSASKQPVSRKVATTLKVIILTTHLKSWDTSRCLWPFSITSSGGDHYSDVIMSAMASQITSLVIVYPTVYSGADQRKHQSLASLASLTGEFPAQRANNAENVPMWWRHHAARDTWKIYLTSQSVLLLLVAWQVLTNISTQTARFVGPTWVLSAPDGPHVGPMNLAIRAVRITCTGYG